MDSNMMPIIFEDEKNSDEYSLIGNLLQDDDKSGLNLGDSARESFVSLQNFDKAQRRNLR
jgi:hypothetical protein